MSVLSKVWDNAWDGCKHTVVNELVDKSRRSIEFKLNRRNHLIWFTTIDTVDYKSLIRSNINMSLKYSLITDEQKMLIFKEIIK